MSARFITWRVAALLLVAMSGVMRASATPLDALQSVPLPGGYRALESLGISADVSRAQILPLVIRLLYQNPEGGNRQDDSRREDFLRTLTALQRVRKAMAAHTGGVALEDARNAQLRSGVRDVLESLGLELAERRGVYAARVAAAAEATRAALTRGGVNVTGLLAKLNAGERTMVVVPVDLLPFPMALPVWEKLLGRRDLEVDTILPTVLASRQASLFTCGLLAMDATSRGWLANSTEALKSAWNNPTSLVVAGRSLVIREGAPSLPGGVAAGQAWETVAGTPLANPDQFVRQLLSRDDGRLAFFLDAIAQLDPPHLAFVLASSPQRREPLRELYDIIARADPGWKIAERPFARSQFDIPILLRAIAVDADGSLAGPTSRALWTSVASGSAPSVKTATPEWLREQGPIDAVWLADRFARLTTNERSTHLQRFLFAQRVFATASDADAADVAFVLLHHATYRTLTVALERMGLTSPVTYAAGIRAAMALGDMSADTRELALTGFQGGLALLTHLRTVSAVEPSAADAAARSLFQLTVDGNRGYQGRLTGWLVTDLAPLWNAVGESSGAGNAERLLAVLAGERNRTGSAFTWESERYVVDSTAYEIERLRGGLRGSSAATLGEAMDLSRRLDQIARAATIDALQSAATDAATAVDGARVQPARAGADEARGVVDDGRKALRDLAEIRNAADLDKVPARMRPLFHLLDRMTAEALRTLVYLTHSGAADVSNVPDLAVRHSFGVGAPGQTDAAERAAPWTLPRVETHVFGSRVYGSLLALDVAMVRTGLRRLQSNTAPRPPSVADAILNVLGHTVLLADTTRLTDAGRDGIAAALQRGRARIASATAATGGATISSLTAELPAMRGWRANALEWVGTNSPADVIRQFTLQEIFTLGTPGPLSSFDAWGISQQLHSGCPCLQLKPPLAAETSGGHAGSAEPAASFDDISLRLAEEMSLQHVPAALFPSLLAFAISDVVEDTSAVDDDDLMALSRATRVLTHDRVADYVAAVVGRGMVTPAGSDGSDTP